MQVQWCIEKQGGRTDPAVSRTFATLTKLWEMAQSLSNIPQNDLIWPSSVCLDCPKRWYGGDRDAHRTVWHSDDGYGLTVHHPSIVISRTPTATLTAVLWWYVRWPQTMIPNLKQSKSRRHKRVGCETGVWVLCETSLWGMGLPVGELVSTWNLKMGVVGADDKIPCLKLRWWLSCWSSVSQVIMKTSITLPKLFSIVGGASTKTSSSPPESSTRPSCVDLVGEVSPSILLKTESCSCWYWTILRATCMAKGLQSCLEKSEKNTYRTLPLVMKIPSRTSSMGLHLPTINCQPFSHFQAPSPSCSFSSHFFLEVKRNRTLPFGPLSNNHIEQAAQSLVPSPRAWIRS